MWLVSSHGLKTYLETCFTYSQRLFEFMIKKHKPMNHALFHSIAEFNKSSFLKGILYSLWMRAQTVYLLIFMVDLHVFIRLDNSVCYNAHKMNSSYSSKHSDSGSVKTGIPCRLEDHFHTAARLLIGKSTFMSHQLHHCIVHRKIFPL